MPRLRSELLPKFETLWEHYPTGTPEEVRALIGGEIDKPKYANTCVIRISRALNYAGRPLPSVFPGLTLIKGRDGLNYALDVREFNNYMTLTYGDPVVNTPMKSFHDNAESAFCKFKGIVMFKVDVWGKNASGHFDLWNGIECGHECFFNIASHVRLWISAQDYNLIGITGQTHKFFKE
jgi:hypothetical protein